MRAVHSGALAIFLGLGAEAICAGSERAMGAGGHAPVRSVVFVDAAARAGWADDSLFGPATPGGAPTATQVRNRNWAIIGGGAAGVIAYGFANWWDDGFTGRFRTVDEGWFGQNTNDGGADKLGHAFANYTGTRLLTWGLQAAGNSPDAALTLAAWSTFLTFTAVEVVDAFTDKWRFSAQDALMNAVGTGAAVLMEKNPGLDRVIDLRLMYKPSDEPRSNYFDPFGDYSGQTYLLVAKASGVGRLREHPLLRYVEVAVGYGTRGYGLPPEDPGERSRYLYAGISLNLSELLDRAVFRGATERSRTERAVDGFLEFLQIPGTAALAKHRL
jgi:hypothetical protein